MYPPPPQVQSRLIAKEVLMYYSEIGISALQLLESDTTIKLSFSSKQDPQNMAKCWWLLSFSSILGKDIYLLVKHNVQYI